MATLPKDQIEIKLISFFYISSNILQTLKHNNYSLEDLTFFFSPIGQEYPFVQVSEIFLSQPAVSV